MAESNSRKIPVKLDDFNVVSDEYSNHRARFNAEMRKMEEEMAKFRSDLLKYEASLFEPISSSTLPWVRQKPKDISNISSPLIQKDGDNKVLQLRFDVSDYTSEEITVETNDQKLLVHAKHEEKSDKKNVYREYSQHFLLPSGVNPESIHSSLSKDGILTVKAVLPAVTAEETIKTITYE